MSLQFVCCKMAKQKRKESEVAEKKSKKLKKVSAVEMPVACAVPPGTGTAPAEVGEVGTLALPVSGPRRALGGRVAGVRVDSPQQTCTVQMQPWDRSELQEAAG